MGATMISLSVKPYRLMTRAEAAYYCSLPPKKFEGQCPFHPVQMPTGEKKWDVRDLDTWIDALKTGCDDDSALIARLE